jgi:hypothetical protein
MATVFHYPIGNVHPEVALLVIAQLMDVISQYGDICEIPSSVRIHNDFHGNYFIRLEYSCINAKKEYYCIIDSIGYLVRSAIEDYITEELEQKKAFVAHSINSPEVYGGEYGTSEGNKYIGDDCL